MSIRPLPTAWGLTLLRIVMGIILVVAGYQKLTGGGFDGFTRFATGLGLPLPQLFGVLIPLQELIGGLLILLGLGARWVAILFVAEFLVTTFVVKMPRPAPAGGWDSMRIDLMLLATSIALVLCGPGELALDRLLRRRRQAAPVGGSSVEVGAAAG